MPRSFNSNLVLLKVGGANQAAQGGLLRFNSNLVLLKELPMRVELCQDNTVSIPIWFY